MSDGFLAFLFWFVAVPLVLYALGVNDGGPGYVPYYNGD